MKREIVIYSRYSSDMQSPKSCADQERDVRTALTRLGIDHRLAVVIHDEAESGTKTLRVEAQRLDEMARKGEIEILAVDDQARFSRADNAFAMITDLVYQGGRFISTGEGIDTTQPGWELRVKVMELHNSTTIRELGRRVRRGQRGRLLARLTAGDYPYGYESFVVHPEKVVVNGRGPKPEKDVRINESEAQWVRKIFTWFVAGRSLTKIATELTKQGVPRGRRCRSKPWKHQQVRTILSNAKFVGDWVWGKTTTLRNSKGKTKQNPVPPEEWVRVTREDLRIIDQQTWDQAQRRLAELLAVYGQKEGQAPRGPRIHHSAAYPSDLLQGLLYCTCGARMHQKQSNKRQYYLCPRTGDAPGMCSMKTTVPRNKAKEAVLKPIVTLLTEQPKWIETALEEMRCVLDRFAAEIPNQADADRKRLADLEKQIETLIDNLSRVQVRSEAMFARLAELEQEAAKLRLQIAEQQNAKSLPSLVPTSVWLREQLGDLRSILEEGGMQAAMLLRNLIGKITVAQVLPPGKQRGYARLRFRIATWQMLKPLLPPPVSQAISAQMIGGSDGAEDLCIDLGAPSAMDEWAPQIAAWREAGVTWKEILKRTGLGSGPAYVCWKRYVDAQKSLPPPKPEESAGDNAA